VNVVLQDYRNHIAERAAEGIVPKALDAEQTAALVELVKNPPAGEDAFLIDLLTNRVPAGVDEAAYVKAGFLAAIAKSETTSPILNPEKATQLLGTMLGGYNIQPMIDLLECDKLSTIAAKGLSNTLLVFDAFHDVQEKAEAGNVAAKQVMQSWADAQWFTSKEKVPTKITVKVFKVTGETNTDDLSPAPDAWSRPDIPLHAKAMLKISREGINPEEDGVIGPITQIEELQKDGIPLAYVGDVVGTGSSRKSATTSVLWFMGADIPCIPHKRSGGVC
jgi:aconitate hydratase 2/2-methylisocitrate dehydratase